MKTFLIGVCAVLLGVVLAVEEAEAKRLGGGRSVGTQRSVTNTPPASTPAKPAQQQAAPGGQQAAPAAPAPSGFSRWLPMLGGLAIGGLLGSMFGGSGFGGILLLALLAIGAVIAFKAFARRREAASQQSVQFAGMGGRETVKVPASSYLPEGSIQTQPTQIAAIPAGFDTATFLRGAKLNFIKLQAANDAGNVDEIREFATQDMFDELSRDMRASVNGGQHTDVVSLDADLLQVVTEGDKHWASVRFSGTVREAPGAAVESFEEVWNLVKPADGSSGWLLAGIQQMQ